MEYLDISSLISALVGASGGVLGALIISKFANDRQASQNKIELTLSLYKEFESVDRNSLRIEARKKLKKLLDKSPPIKNHQIKAEYPDDYPDIHQLFHFYERIAILCLGNYLDKELFRKTLRRHYIIFYKEDMQAFIADSFDNVEHKEEDVHWVAPVKELGEKLLKEEAKKNNLLSILNIKKS